MNPLKNGLELTIQLQVLCEFLDQYPIKREIVKEKGMSFFNKILL